ncbi:MAG: ABC transporter ATP-binding protein [Rhodospirillales bacterium]
MAHDAAPLPPADRAAPPPAPVAVHVRGARLVYGGTVLFDELDVVLPGGRWTCILGPSGVGKSSLIRLGAGLAPAGPGTRIDADDGRPLRGRVALMAQQDLLLPWLTLAENVRLGARLRGASGAALADADRRARALLAQVGLAAVADARPAACSGGMRQRAAIARTLFEDRPIVLMDEPFSALDAITRTRVQEIAAAMLAGRTVMLVTHDPLEALRLGHRIHVLSGRPARLGEALEPAGAPPRDPADPALLAAHAELLRRLRAAAGDEP